MPGVQETLMEKRGIEMKSEKVKQVNSFWTACSWECYRQFGRKVLDPAKYTRLREAFIDQKIRADERKKIWKALGKVGKRLLRDIKRKHRD